MNELKDTFFWKGKRVSEQVFKARINQQQAGKIRGKISYTKDRVKHNLDSCNTR